MSNFAKKNECPTSVELNAFAQGETTSTDGRQTMLHLRECEFCAAETEFYAMYPQTLEPATATAEPALPEPLRELAESLLNRKRSATALESLLTRSRN